MAGLQSEKKRLADSTRFGGQRYREGFLWKRGRDNGQFLSRKFILSEREGALKYFNKHDAREPKAIMKIESLNATFQPSKIGNPNGLQITYLKDNSTRNIFVHHEDGKEIVDWFNAIRAARFHYLQVAFPGASDADLVPKLTRNYLKEGYMEKTGPKLVPKLTRNYLKEGYMEKTGPKHTEGFKKRWFTMDDRRLMYFKDPLDAYARGEVFIGSKDNSYVVKPGLPPSTQGYHWQHGITIVTPDRKFLFACETEQDQVAWIAAFQKVINRPMLPQEYAEREAVPSGIAVRSRCVWWRAPRRCNCASIASGVVQMGGLRLQAFRAPAGTAEAGAEAALEAAWVGSIGTVTLGADGLGSHVRRFLVLADGPLNNLLWRLGGGTSGRLVAP
ncbi:UNVERIFIED_CONTAM: hypothetical protein FKN15_039607 [Acipenser sinensis]